MNEEPTYDIVKTGKVNWTLKRNGDDFAFITGNKVLSYGWTWSSVGDRFNHSNRQFSTMPETVEHAKLHCDPSKDGRLCECCGSYLSHDDCCCRGCCIGCQRKRPIVELMYNGRSVSKHAERKLGCGKKGCVASECCGCSADKKLTIIRMPLDVL